MIESRQKLYTWRACALAIDGIVTILSCAIFLAGSLSALSSLPLTLESIDCTLHCGNTEIEINCNNSSADEATQLEAIEEALARRLPESVGRLLILNSRISRWPSQICNLTTMREIHLDDNQITEIPNDCINRILDLEVLSVQRNRLSFLQDGLFDGMKKLKWLWFQRNQITSIGLRVFSNRSDLPSLKSISLEDNYLTVLEPWPFIRAQVVEGVTVDLAGNLISRFTNALGWSYTCGMKPLKMDLELGSNQIRHLTDLTDAFNLTSMINLVCLFGTKAHTKFDIKFKNNPIICDCNDYKIMAIVKKFQYVGFLDDLHCKEPIHLADQKLVTVMSNLEQFVCEIHDLCPPNGRCILVPANRTLIVHASNAGLQTLPLQLPPLKTVRYSYQLDFSRNSIAVLTSRAYLANGTFSLDVSQSGVESVTDEAWRDLSSIPESIRLHSNRLTTLSPLIQNVNYSFRSLSLYGNPLSCSCQDSWIKHWLERLRGRLEGTDSILCVSPPWLSGRVIFTVEDFEHCRDPNTSKMAAIGTSTAIGILVVLVVLAFVAVHRLRIHLFAAFRVHPFDRDDCEDEEMDHDVFLTCSHEDRSHAFKVLRLLEDNKFKVCYHERDFMVGQTIADNICQAVFRSRRVLCLVSESFVNSSYCVYEFETALDYNVKLKRKRVVVLLLEKIDVRGSTVPRELQQYLSSHTVVEYWSSNWANNLLYAMPTKPLLLPSSDGEVVTEI